MRRPGAIAIARAVNALFFLALSAYCFLAYTPFAYDAFIKPGVSHALWFFIVIAPALFWVVLLVTGLTLMPQLSTRGARGRVASWAHHRRRRRRHRRRRTAADEHRQHAGGVLARDRGAGVADRDRGDRSSRVAGAERSTTSIPLAR